jgi:O-antigen/teichoic acid export membrane protein
LLLYARRRHCPRPAEARYRPDARERKRLFRYGLFNNFNDAGTMVLSTKSDNFFIAAFLDPVAVGIYAFYNRLNEMLSNLQPARLFDNVVQPLVFAVPPADGDEKIPKYFSFLLNTTLLLQLPVLVFSIAYHAELVAVVFGGKFIDYSWLFPLVVAFATLQTIAKPVTLVAQYEEKAGIILLSKIFAIYNVAALLVLIPLAGLYGAVAATGSAAFFKNLFIWWYARRRARWLQFGPMLLASILTWSATLGLCLLAKSLFDLANLTDIIIGLAIIAVGGLVHVRTPALSASDRQILANVFRGKEARILHLVGMIRLPSGERLR